MSAKFTVYDKVTWQVFGRGEQDEVHQCPIGNVLVRDVKRRQMGARGYGTDYDTLSSKADWPSSRRLLRGCNG